MAQMGHTDASLALKVYSKAPFPGLS